VRSVFADTLYWVAITRPGDPWEGPARRAKEALGSVRLVTTDEVLTEFLTLVGQTEGGRRRRWSARSCETPTCG
jgi:hypothetical protein